MGEYYKIDSRKITLREYWNILPSWKILIPWIAGRLNVQTSFGSGFRQPDSVREMEVPEGEFSPEARTGLQPVLDQCLQLGFHSLRFYSFENIRRDTRTSFISLLHRSGELTLRLMYTRATKVNPPVVNRLVVLLSELNDGTYFFTSDQKPKFLSGPGILANRHVGAPPGQLVESHLQKLTQFQSKNPPRPVPSIEKLDEVWDRYERVSVDFGLKRGLYVPMPPEEVENEQRVMTAAATLTAGGADHAAVLVELDQLQNKKAGWGNALFLFVVSMLLFVGVGSRQWSWSYVLLLVPILFVHELGHFVAMRAFNYRNLRMFFIPFFGAAVAGRHYNVPNWKKVVVSLMGPVPGILLAVIIGGAGLIFHNPLLTKVAIVTLFLNGFNLLPVLPLDGGWVVHALLFSRHPVLDAAFRVAAVIGLAALGMFTKAKILMYLGIPMLFGIPLVYRMARITETLRKRGLTPVSEDDQTIPPDTAQAIITEVKKTIPARHTTKMVAQQTLQIFEALNARPPGWPATIGLLFAYAVSLGVAVVFAGVFVIGQRGEFGGAFSRGANQLRHVLKCGTSTSWRGPQADAAADVPPVTIVANFPTQRVALRGLTVHTNQLPSSAVLTLFGDSVFLTLPAGDGGLRKKWFSGLQHQTTEVFVDSTNFPAMLSVTCRVADKELATTLENELNEYFSNDSTRSLIPPWIPEDRRTPEQRATHQLARKTHLKLESGRWDGYSDPRIAALQKKISAAQRQGDETEAASLNRQVTQLAEELGSQRLDKLRSGEDGPADKTVIDLFRALPSVASSTNQEVFSETHQQIAVRMGQLPLVDGRVRSADGRFSTRSGSVSTIGGTLHLSWLSFNRISEGAPALIDWLCEHGCAEFKYDIHTGPSLGEDDDK